ncbi:uncharacterized protein LOC103313394 isoform X1 [Tribolium castaneum]|uniref:uncharacterized protein LOC103313394 isoform X1 n=1 Tax=Tribolium castaneum TaxID=7070 RepID=UPI0030FE2431
MLRRVKSFTIKKYKSSDELKPITPPSPRVRPKRRQLQKEKSFSLESVPIHLDLEKNDLFLRQREKAKRHEIAQQQLPNLARRKSISCDDDKFRRLNQSPVTTRRVKFSARERSRYNTVDVLNSAFHSLAMNQKLSKIGQKPPKSGIEVVRFEPTPSPPPPAIAAPTNLIRSKSDWYINIQKDDDLFTEIDSGPKDESSSNKPQNFPVFEEQEILLRKPSLKPERPKTYSSTVTKKIEKTHFDFDGVKGLELLNERQCIKIGEEDILRLDGKELKLLRGNTENVIKRNISMKKGVKFITKKTLEMSDVDTNLYWLTFSSHKDAKLFIEKEKSFHALPSTIKPMGPFWQLRKLLKKRSSRDLLELKGIIKNEPIFGNTLEELVSEEHPVPEVITRIVRLIEEPENITSVGLYRASANLAVVQNIRFEINCGRWEILDKHGTDVDVLAGTLKLFFRELKQPLISAEVYEELREAITNGKFEIRTVVDNLPAPSRNTLLFIIKHLLKVCEHKDANKMDFYNLAICWGPTLITLPSSCSDLVAQTTGFTKVTEQLLCYYKEHPEFIADDYVPKTKDFVYQVVQKLTEIIDTGIETEGIYRKSGSNAKIDNIMKQLEKQNLTEIDEKTDIHDLCCALKKFLSSLKEPLIPNEFLCQYCEICDKLEYSVLRNEIRRMVQQVPRKDALLLLFEHLKNVLSFSKRNKMSEIILCDIWMTTLASSTYRKKVPKFFKLFELLLYLDEEVLPDLIKETRVRESRYDNVPDDISDDTTSSQQMYTKL